MPFEDSTTKGKVEKLIEDEGIDLFDYISGITKSRWAQILNCPISSINYSVSRIREENGVRERCSRFGSRKITRVSRSDLYYLLLKNGFNRGSPSHEKKSCEIISEALIYRMPRGGKPLLIGTPTPLSVSKRKTNDYISDDNLMVAHTLKVTTSGRGTIIIGNGVNEKKALLKGKHWRSLNTFTNFDIVIKKVDSQSFREEVESLARLQKYRNSIAKVVLMTSGVWFCSEPTRKKYDLNLDFATPSLELTEKYDNLYILAMTRGSDHSRHFCFPVVFLHNGKSEIIDKLYKF